jgi:transcriptional pleiotropic repressor
MSDIKLLDSTRKINRILYGNQNGTQSDGQQSVISFNELAKALGESIDASIRVISQKGKVLGVYESEKVDKLNEMISDVRGKYIDLSLNERFLNILSTQENMLVQSLGFEGVEEKGYKAQVCPLFITGERLGTLFVYQNEGDFSINDTVLCEYTSTVIGLIMLSSVDKEIAEERRKQSVVKSSMATLSYSEVEAIKRIFEELNGNKEGLLVASKIADKAKITRSVIVNALRKLESAGIIKSKSSGMRGTYIHVLNDAIFEEISDV